MDYIVLVGQRSAGKDVVAEYLQSEYGLEQVVFSKEITDLGLELGQITQDMLDHDLKGTQADWGKRLRQMENGSELYTMRVIDKARQGYHIINGMRDPIELSIIDRELQDYMVMGVTAGFFTRYKRTLGIKKTRNLWHFIQLENKFTEKYIRNLVKNADIIINNSGTLEDVYSTLDDVVQEKELNK